MVATMKGQEAHHARLDCDKAEDINTDAAKVAWFNKWARRLADHAFETVPQ